MVLPTWQSFYLILYFSYIIFQSHTNFIFPFILYISLSYKYMPSSDVHLYSLDLLLYSLRLTVVLVFIVGIYLCTFIWWNQRVCSYIPTQELPIKIFWPQKCMCIEGRFFLYVTVDVCPYTFNSHFCRF